MTKTKIETMTTNELDLASEDGSRGVGRGPPAPDDGGGGVCIPGALFDAGGLSEAGSFGAAAPSPIPARSAQVRPVKVVRKLSPR